MVVLGHPPAKSPPSTSLLASMLLALRTATTLPQLDLCRAAQWRAVTGRCSRLDNTDLTRALQAKQGDGLMILRSAHIAEGLHRGSQDIPIQG